MSRPRRKAAIYTRTGDRGETGLFSGDRLSKAHAIFDALGDVDELNCKLAGVRLALLDDADDEFEETVREIQSRLLDIGSSLATPRDRTLSRTKLSRTHFDSCHVDWLETFIDRLEPRVPRLNSFILPSGGKRAVAFHEARAIARRAERHVIRAAEHFALEDPVLQFLNRLSDLFFLCARYYSLADGYVEHRYRKPRRHGTTTVASVADGTANAGHASGAGSGPA